MSTTAIDSTDGARPDETPVSRYLRAVEISCRVMAVVVAAIMLVLLLPVMIVIAAAIRLESPGPVLFRQRRVGRAQAPFMMNKFRTMRQGASHQVHRDFVLSLIKGETPAAADGAPRFKLTSDPRVTRVGRVLRRTSLDELPQLLNVLRSQMSLVGPRPPIPYEVEHYPPHWC